MHSNDSKQYDSALGCMLGACIGDAAGAVLEFLGRKPTSLDVDHALTMPGGGVFNVAPGQITDDGELTLSLAHGLLRSGSFSIENIARSYADWIESRPFDIGMTTMSSLGCFTEDDWKVLCEKAGFAIAMAKAANELCMDSKANGSLMRATPIGIWGHRLKPTVIARIAKDDSCLSHPNSSCWQAVACYAIAISSLIDNANNGQAAFDLAFDWADSFANAEVLGWMVDARENNNIPYQPLDGFVKIAFTHAFRHLLLESTYEEALLETLLGGGDTDTNACIVGGLVGAACGASSIPDHLKQSVLNCDTTKGRKPRPAQLSSGQIPDLAKNLLAKAPAAF
jgi:ADP-ribosyl-[dinitrogen reductase] hydrolase